MRNAQFAEVAIPIVDILTERHVCGGFHDRLLHGFLESFQHADNTFGQDNRADTRVVGTFPDGKSALMLVCARLRYVSGKEWGTKRYLCMKYLTEVANEVA